MHTTAHTTSPVLSFAGPAGAVMQMQPGEQVLRKGHLPASVKTDKLVFVQLRVGEEVYHRCLVRHAAPDGSVLDIKVFKGDTRVTAVTRSDTHVACLMQC
jgi:hypothetical protein